MRKLTIGVLAALLLALPVVSALADDQERPPDFVLIIGPRIGVSYNLTTPADFSATVMDLFPVGTYYPVNSLFGIICEQRILLGQTSSHFAFQEVVLIAGLEQSIALPTASLLIGYRDASGFEVGFGPAVTLSSIGVVVAVGYTLGFNGVYVPIDISCVLPNAQQPASFALTTGFNFITRTRYNSN